MGIIPPKNTIKLALIDKELLENEDRGLDKACMLIL